MFARLFIRWSLRLRLTVFLTAQILMNVRKILGIVILMLLVPTPSATSSVNVMVGLWETEQVAQVSSMKLKWHLWVLSSWSNTGNENLGKRCRKYILIHMQTLLLRLLNWPILKRKSATTTFFPPPFLVRPSSILPPPLLFFTAFGLIFRLSSWSVNCHLSSILDKLR